LFFIFRWGALLKKEVEVEIISKTQPLIFTMDEKQHKEDFLKGLLVILDFLLLVIIFILVFDLMILIFVTTFEKETFKTNVYSIHAESISNDPLILTVSEKCDYSKNKVRCVFDETVFEYDDERAIKNYPTFISPEKYFTIGGICRDSAVIRDSILMNLGINCLYDFSTPHHVFLVCFYEGKAYELNNNNFRVVDNG